MERRNYQLSTRTKLILLSEAIVLLWLSCPAESRKIWSPNPRMNDDTVVRAVWGWPIRCLISETPAGPPTRDEYVGGYSERCRSYDLLGFAVDLIIVLFVFGYTIGSCEKQFAFVTDWLRQHLLTFFIIGLLLILPAYSSDPPANFFLGLASLAFLAYGYEFSCSLQASETSLNESKHAKNVRNVKEICAKIMMGLIVLLALLAAINPFIHFPYLSVALYGTWASILITGIAPIILPGIVGLRVRFSLQALMITVISGATCVTMIVSDNQFLIAFGIVGLTCLFIVLICEAADQNRAEG